MQRYFNNDLIDNKFILNNDDSFHIEKVMRMNLNDHIEVVCHNKVYLCSIDSFNPVNCHVIKELVEDHEFKKKVIIVQSLVNEQKMDFILQKGTELGMTEFIPYNAFNSVIKPNDKMDKKIVRWQRIVKEAAEQSKRNIIPTVNKVINIDELIKLDASLKLICSLRETSKSIKNILQDNSNCDTMIIVIGPEGGFAINEEEKLINNGFIPVSLGSRVLRTETASLVLLSMLNYEWMV